MTATPPIGHINKPLPLGVIYIAGPMRGLPQFNFPAFLKADKVLKSKGWETRNPAVKDLDVGFDPTDMKGTMAEMVEANFDMREAITWDLLSIINECDAVALLPGWRNSRGAITEYALARFLDLPVYVYDPAQSTALQPKSGGMDINV